MLFDLFVFNYKFDCINFEFKFGLNRHLPTKIFN